MGKSLLNLAMAVAAGLLAAPVAQAAECAPERMVRVVFRNDTPGVDRASFAAKPRTLYRLGERYGRVEEELNPATGHHLLIVVAEPDVWMTDLAAGKGQHVVDPGPTFEFRAPIFVTQGLPPVFGRLETGCELDFVATYAPVAVGKVTVEGVALDRHQVSVGRDRIEILVRPDGRQVVSVAHYRDERPLTVLRYLDYAVDLPPNMALFAKPPGVAYAKPAPPPKS